MTEKEVKERKEAIEEGKSVIAILNSRKGSLSGNEDDLTLAANARELSEVLELVGKAMESHAKVIPATSALLVLDALQATMVQDSPAHVWLKNEKAAWAAKTAPVDAVLTAVAKGLVRKYVETKELEWMRRLLDLRLEKGESPNEMMGRATMFNKNSGNKMDKPQLRLLLLAAIQKGDPNDELMLGDASDKADLDEAVKAAQAVWERKPKAKAKAAAAVAVDEQGGRVMESGGCYFCGEKGHIVRECPRMPCLGCGKKGHMLSDCNKSKKEYPKTQPKPGVKVGGSRVARRRETARAAAAAARASQDRRLFVKAEVGGVVAGSLLDNGATCSVIGIDRLKGMQYARVAAPYAAIEGLSPSGAVKVLYGATMDVVVGSVKIEVTFAVVPSAHIPDGILLGVDALEQLGLMDAMSAALKGLGAEIMWGSKSAATAATAKESESDRRDEEDRWETVEAINAYDLSHLDDLPKERDELRAILLEHRRAFLREGRLPKKANIPPVVIRVSGPPVIVSQRPWSPEVQEKLADHEHLLVGEGLARWVESAAWRGEPLLVWKPDGTTRYTGDYRKTNRSIMMESYPTASLPEELRKLAHGTVFSGYDFAFGFWQVPVAEESQEISTLRSAVPAKGLMVTEVLPMGYNASPPIFTREVRKHVINKLPDDVREKTGQYADDIGHASAGERAKAVREELRAIEATLKAIIAAGFVLKLRKCRFAVMSMVWCGFLLAEGGRLPDPERTRAFLEMGEPANKAELVRWLGVAGSLRSGVPYFSQLAAPLHKRTHRTAQRLMASAEYEEELESLRNAIRSAPPLDEPLKGVPLDVEVDGSTVGYGAVLKQAGRVCATASRAKTKAELNYGSFDNEWAAVVFGLESFEFWLSGRDDTTVKSDLKGLTEGDLVLHAPEDKTGRRARWVDRTAYFRYKLKWVPREELMVADALAKSPAFREPVLKLREEVEMEAREQVARVASGRGGGMGEAKKELRRAKRDLTKARREEEQRNVYSTRSATKAAREEAVKAEKERAEAEAEAAESEVETKAVESTAAAPVGRAADESRAGGNGHELLTAALSGGSITKAARRAERRRRRRERRKEKKRSAAVSAARAAATPAAETTVETIVVEPKRPAAKETREAQLKDPKLKALIGYIEGEVPNVTLLEMRRLAAQAEHMALREGVLGHINKPSAKKEQSEWTWTQIVPDVDDARRRWFEKAHAQEGGHMAHGATYARLLRMVYWDTMWADCLAWCGSCVICDLFSKPKLDHGFLQPTTTESLKGQRRIHVDLAGPFEEDEFGNTYMMIAVDREDLWPTIVPIRSSEAKETTRALCGVSADSGVPEVLVSDQGSNFTAVHSKDFYWAMGIEPKLSSPEAPWSNGAAEAMVKIAKKVTAKLVEEKRKVWSSLTWIVNLVLRSRELSGWKISPFEARFARTMRTPAMFDLTFDDQKIPEIKDLRKMKDILDKKRDEVAAEMKRMFDKKVTKADFKEKDKVWLVPRQKAGALQPLKIGPFEIKEVKGPAHVTIKQTEGGPSLGQRSGTQSVRNLEKYDHKEVYKQKESMVKEILGHEGKGRGRKYKVLWDDGTTSLELRKQLVDKEMDGTETINEQLTAYFERNPKISRNV